MNILILIGVAIAAAGGIVAAIAATRLQRTSQNIAERVEEVERRMLITQVRMMNESVMSESFYLEQISDSLKKMMIEEAIADGSHTSDRFTAQITTIDKRKASVAGIQQDAQKLSSAAAALLKMDAEKTESNSVAFGRSPCQATRGEEAVRKSPASATRRGATLC